jgi:hypothetical protein
MKRVSDSRSRRRMRDGSRLQEIVSRRRRTGSAPRSAFEAVTRQKVRSLRGEVRDVKHRINQILTLIIAAILIEMLMRLIGIGL